MSTMLLRTFATIAALLGLASIAQADVDVDIRLASPDAVDVSYRLPLQCSQLRFDKSGALAGQIRASWEPQQGCGTVDGDTLSRTNARCELLRFRVPTNSDPITGYPAAFPLTGGIYVHTQNYAVDDHCGAVHYRFVAPHIATGGRQFTSEAQAAAGGDTPALLLEQPLVESTDTLAYFDPRLSAASIAQVKEVADGTVAFLKASLPDAVFKQPILAAVAAHQPGGPNIGGNAGDVLLLSLYNWPEQPGTDERFKLTLLVAHELSHRFQLRDAVDVYPDARLIHEGGAEFLRWVTSIRQGWITPARAAEDLDGALADCTLHVGDQGWRSLSAQAIADNRLEYRCGLAAYVYGLAARQGQDSALMRFNDFYKALRQGQVPDFAQALECGANASCLPRWLPQLLGDAPMSSAWQEMFESTGLAAPRPPTQMQRDAMMMQAIDQLVRDDCNGHRSTTPTKDGVLLDGMPVCKTLRNNLHLTRVEDEPVFGDDKALAAMASACALHHVVRLTGQQGETVTVPCSRPYQARAAFYHADIEKILGQLKARSSNQYAIPR